MFSMRKFLVVTVSATVVLLVIGAVLYSQAQAKCAPVIGARMHRGYDGAPSLCGAEFYLYLPFASIIWFSLVLSSLFRMLKERKK